jgi:hypothetical protein
MSSLLSCLFAVSAASSVLELTGQPVGTATAVVDAVGLVVIGWEALERAEALAETAADVVARGGADGVGAAGVLAAGEAAAFADVWFCEQLAVARTAASAAAAQAAAGVGRYFKVVSLRSTRALAVRPRVPAAGGPPSTAAAAVAH